MDMGESEYFEPDGNHMGIMSFNSLKAYSP